MKIEVMKTNQIFSFKRFANFFKSMVIQRYRSLLFMLGEGAVAIFGVCMFFVIANYGWDGDDWQVLFYFSVSIAGLLYVGSAYPAFRNAKKTQSYLMLPASAFEKFIYEFFERIVLFMLLFPVLFFVFSNLATATSTLFIDETRRSLPSFFRFSDLVYRFSEGTLPVFIWVGICGLSLAFAGAARFRKYPLLKAILFVLAVIGVSGYYIYIIVEKLDLRHPYFENLLYDMTNEQGYCLIKCILAFISVVALAYAYFKQKEKEIV